MTKVITDENKIKEFLGSRYIEAVFPSKERTAEIMKSGKQLVFYWGIDPTGPDVHLGHTTSVLLLKKLVELGHKVILLIGSFTAMIGDPTGKDASRKVLNKEDVKNNMRTYLEQIQKILPKKNFDVKYNASWYDKMEVEDFIKLTDYVTVQQMIAREMFQKRIKEDKPISLREFLYPILQGYDSIAMEVDGEVGGNDQTFNMLVGRDLVKSILGKEKIIITTRLLEDAVTGKKIMNKSEGHYIAVNDQPQEMFGKIMAMPDSAIAPLFTYTTEVSDELISEVRSQLENGKNPKELKEELALELVRMYHGEEEAQKAKENFESVFSKGNLPEDIEEVENKGTILQTMVVAGIVPSSSEGKRLIEQGAVKINEQVVSRWDEEGKSGDIIKIGPRKFIKLK